MTFGRICFLYDLTARGQCEDEQFTIHKKGNIHIDLEFKTPLAETNTFSCLESLIVSLNQMKTETYFWIFTEMDSIQLKRILKTDSMTKHSFQGVHASDQLTQIQTPVHFPASYVINEHRFTKGGSHWIAPYIDHQTVEYFESYGQPHIPSFKKFIRRLSQQQMSHNEKQLQSFQTQTCGPFCIFYLIKKQEGSSLEKMIKTYFTTNPFKLLINDMIIWLETMFVPVKIYIFH